MGGAHAKPVMHPTEITNLGVNHFRGVDVVDNGAEHVHEFRALHLLVGEPDGGTEEVRGHQPVSRGQRPPTNPPVSPAYSHDTTTHK